MDWRSEYKYIEGLVRKINENKELVEEHEKIITVTDDNGDSYEESIIYSVLNDFWFYDRVMLKKNDAVIYFSRKLKKRLKEMLRIKEQLLELLEKEKEEFISNIYEAIAEMNENNFDVEDTIRKYKKYLEYEWEFQKYSEVLAEMQKAYAEAINKESNERDIIFQNLLNEFKSKYNTHPNIVLLSKNDNSFVFLTIKNDEVFLLKEREFNEDEEKEFNEYLDSLKQYYHIREYLSNLVEISERVYLVNFKRAIRVKYIHEDMKYFENDDIVKIEFEELQENEYKELFKKFLRRYHPHFITINDFEIKNNAIIVEVDLDQKGKFIGQGGKNIKAFAEKLRELFKNQELKVFLK